jgi:hypothetical protein
MGSATPFGERMARGGEVMQQRPRVLRPNRAQIELRATDLEGLLPEDHRARAVWEFVEGLELSVLYERIESVEGHAVGLPRGARDRARRLANPERGAADG